MRYLVLSDIHANLEALEACLSDAAVRGYDECLVLGDLVGYGADPNRVVERVQQLNPFRTVRGNHDKVACGLDYAEGFNAVARSAAVWTFETMIPAYRDWLAALPKGPTAVDALVEICHGSPFDEDAYIFDEADALKALHVTTRPLCLYGHTHYPMTFALSAQGLESTGPASTAEARLELRQGVSYLLNPGSVGQPRDGDPRAAYAIVDVPHRVVELFRIPYPVEETQAKVIAAGLPEVLARRLAAGR
jgi:diadenosine tetraphosphatase ApaH/serine/threonine PP2A family protein phosphatase